LDSESVYNLCGAASFVHYSPTGCLLQVSNPGAASLTDPPIWTLMILTAKDSQSSNTSKPYSSLEEIGRLYECKDKGSQEDGQRRVVCTSVLISSPIYLVLFLCVIQPFPWNASILKDVVHQRSAARTAAGPYTPAISTVSGSGPHSTISASSLRSYSRKNMAGGSAEELPNPDKLDEDAKRQLQVLCISREGFVQLERKKEVVRDACIQYKIRLGMLFVH
jgi:hypothetical protein